MHITGIIEIKRCIQIYYLIFTSICTLSSVGAGIGIFDSMTLW